MSNTSEVSHASTSEAKYKGIRQRKWGKWVSEIRVPGTQDRLWLGTYKTPEGAAVAHDTAYYCLRGSSCMNKLNFPLLLPSHDVLQAAMSPGSIQKAASDAGMEIDAQLMRKMHENDQTGTDLFGGNLGGIQGTGDHVIQGESDLNISVEDYL